MAKKPKPPRIGTFEFINNSLEIRKTIYRHAQKAFIAAEGQAVWDVARKALLEAWAKEPNAQETRLIMSRTPGVYSNTAYGIHRLHARGHIKFKGSEMAELLGEAKMRVLPPGDRSDKDWFIKTQDQRNQEHDTYNALKRALKAVGLHEAR